MAISDKKIFAALEYASWQHRFQRRKGFSRIPYINHPIRVAKILIDLIDNPLEELILAAILHDVVEDTDSTLEDITRLFGAKVSSIVEEVTDDMTLSPQMRKDLQIVKAKNLTDEAKLIKIADKISNINDLINYPISWTNVRKKKYILWSQKVVDGCRGIDPALDKHFDNTCTRGLKKIK